MCDECWNSRGERFWGGNISISGFLLQILYSLCENSYKCIIQREVVGLGVLFLSTLWLATIQRSLTSCNSLGWCLGGSRNTWLRNAVCHQGWYLKDSGISWCEKLVHWFTIVIPSVANPFWLSGIVGVESKYNLTCCKLKTGRHHQVVQEFPALSFLYS